MNRLAEKTLPIMNDEEVQDLIMDHYKGESQTLTTGAEANLLKFRELTGTLSDEESERWKEIKKVYQRNQLMGQGDPSDPVGRIVAQLTGFSEGLQDIRQSLDGRFEALTSKPLVDLNPVSGDLNRIAEVLERRVSTDPTLRGEAKEGAANQIPSASALAGLEKTLEGIRHALSNELPRAVAVLASDASVEQVQSELSNLKDDLSLVREILSRYEREQTTKPREGTESAGGEGVDLSGITISKRTLKEIYQLIEKDERYLERSKKSRNSKGEKNVPQNLK
ncbi:MAG: hypothetical protein HN774_12895 [Bacteroidetes Order II. Incertae sedis bacterium]|nr:hypothetical protein [Bacteroidetes Order II. bacterium]